MAQQPQLPEPEKVKKTLAKMREVCRQFDSLNFSLDELIALIEAYIRNSVLTAYRLGKIKSVSEPVESEN